MLLGTRNEKQTGLEYLTNPQTYDLLQKRQKEKQLLDLINQKDQTIAILHQINTRMGAQLSTLQRNLGIDSEALLHQLQNLNQISIGFHYQLQQLQHLDSLFKSYDDNNIKQKKLVLIDNYSQQIAMLYSELEDSQKKAQNLVRDNQFLLNQMQNKCKQILQIYSKGFPEDNLVQTYSKLFKDLQLQINYNDKLKQQNEYLTTYNNQLNEKYLQLQLSYDQATTSTQKYFTAYKSQSQQLKSAFIKVDDLTKVKQVLERKFDQISQQNIQLQSSNELLQSRVIKLQQQLKRSRGQYLLNKKTNKQQLQKITLQMEGLKMQLDNIGKRERQGFSKIMIYQRQNDMLRETNRQLKKEIEKTKSDFENTIKMLQAYQGKINNYENKLKAMDTLVQQTKNTLDDTILDKQKSMLKIDFLQKQNQSLVQKHTQQSTQLKLSFQKIINNLNQKIQFLQTQKQQLNDYAHQQQVTSKNQHQKLKRTNQQLRNQNNNLLQTIKSNSGNDIITKIRDLQQRNQSLNKQLIQIQRQLSQQKQLYEQTIDNLKQDIRDLNRQVQKQRQINSNHLRQLTQVKSNLLITNNQKDCRQNQLTRLKKMLDQKMFSNLEQKDWKVKELQQKLQDAILREKKIRSQAIEKLEKYDQTEKELEMEYRNIINGLEKEIEQLKRKLRKRAVER